MFLEWHALPPLQLFQPETDTGVLNRFPLAARRALVHETTSTLLKAASVTINSSGSAASADGSGGVGAGPLAPRPPASINDILVSPFHLRFMMEIVGQGFALPLEDMATITNAGVLYSQWLLEKQLRPRVIEQDHEQVFWRAYGGGNVGARTVSEYHEIVMTSPLLKHSIFQHVTLLFEHRRIDWKAAGAMALFNRHVEMCRNMLKMLVTSARMLANEFTTLTWTTLLKSMLGIADYLLHDPITTTNPSLSDEIAEPLLRSLLEIWLRSKNMDVELWRLLTLAFRRWKHRVEAVSHWSAVVLALTQRIVHVIKHGADTLASSKTAASEPSIIIVLPGSASIVIPLPIEYSVFAWYQMLYLLGSVQDESLTSAGFAAALKGISSIVDTILMLSSSAIDTTLSSIASPIVDAPVAGGGVGGLSVIAEAPSAMYQLQTSFDMQGSSIGSLADGNTLLRMVGPWLFDAVFVTPPASMVNAAFEEGRALAVSALCRIFAMRQARQPISPNFLAQFHRAMRHVLRQAAMAPSDKTGERWSSFERSVSSAALLGLRNVWLTVHDVAPRQSKSGGDNAPAGATCGLLRGLRQLAPWIIIVIRDLLLSTSQLPMFKATKRMVEQRFYAVKFLSAIVVQWHHFASLPLSEDLRVLLSKGMTTSQILGQYIEQQRDIRGDARVVSELSAYTLDFVITAVTREKGRRNFCSLLSVASALLMDSTTRHHNAMATHVLMGVLQDWFFSKQTWLSTQHTGSFTLEPTTVVVPWSSQVTCTVIAFVEHLLQEFEAAEELPPTLAEFTKIIFRFVSEAHAGLLHVARHCVLSDSEDRTSTAVINNAAQPSVLPPHLEQHRSFMSALTAVQPSRHTSPLAALLTVPSVLQQAALGASSAALSTITSGSGKTGTLKAATQSTVTSLQYQFGVETVVGGIRLTTKLLELQLRRQHAVIGLSIGPLAPAISGYTELLSRAVTGTEKPGDLFKPTKKAAVGDAEAEESVPKLQMKSRKDKTKHASSFYELELSTASLDQLLADIGYLSLFQCMHFLGGRRHHPMLGPMRSFFTQWEECGEIAFQLRARGREAHSKELSRKTQPRQACRYFILDRRCILGLMTSSVESANTSEQVLYVVIRDPTGRHCWRLRRGVRRHREEVIDAVAAGEGGIVPSSATAIAQATTAVTVNAAVAGVPAGGNAGVTTVSAGAGASSSTSLPRMRGASHASLSRVSAISGGDIGGTVGDLTRSASKNDMIRCPFPRMFGEFTHEEALQVRSLPTFEGLGRFAPYDATVDLFRRQVDAEAAVTAHTADGAVTTTIEAAVSDSATEAVQEATASSTAPGAVQEVASSDTAPEVVQEAGQKAEEAASAAANVTQQQPASTPIKQQLATIPLSATLGECAPDFDCIDRLFLTQCGLLNAESRRRLIAIDDRAGTLRIDLAALDALPERECISVAILHFDSALQSFDEALFGQSGSSKRLTADFSGFLRAIGWTVDLATHTGWPGAYRRVQDHIDDSTPASSNSSAAAHGEASGVLSASICAPYWADDNHEVIFHVPYCIRYREESVDSPLGMMKSLLSDDLVFVLWLESVDEFQSAVRAVNQALNEKFLVSPAADTTIPAARPIVTGGMAFIVVHPLRDAPGLYVVRILTNEFEPYTEKIHESLVDGSIVSRVQLGQAVRQTAVAIHRECLRKLTARSTFASLHDSVGRTMALAMAKSAASLNTDGSDPNRQQSDNAADNNSIFPYSFCPHPHLRYRFPSQLRRGLIQELAAKYGSNSSGDSKTTSLESVGIAGFFGGLLV